MKLGALNLGLLLTLAGCATSQRVALASFAVDNTFYNSLIESRRPHYGDGQPDGCLIETAFSLKLHTVSADSALGIVYEAGTITPVPYATVRVLPQHATEALTLVTNSAGHFTISRSRTIRRIDVSMPGYRTLTIKLTSEKVF